MDVERKKDRGREKGKEGERKEERKEEGRMKTVTKKRILEKRTLPDLF